MRNAYRGESNALLVVVVGVALLVGAVFTYISFIGMQYTAMPTSVTYAPRVVEPAMGAAPRGATASFLANRLTSAVPQGLKRTEAAFWQAELILPFADTRICASKVKEGKVTMAFSWVDAPALQNGVPGCEEYSTLPGNKSLFDAIGVEYVLDGKEIALKRHPGSGATTWNTIVDPEFDEPVLTCQQLIEEVTGGYKPSEQCTVATWGTNISSLLTPGQHPAVFTLSADPEHAQCITGGEDWVVNTVVTVDGDC